MRISTANSYQTSLDTLVNRQAELTGTQQQLSTGKRVNRASDDPAAAARAERALASERRTVANQRAVDASSNSMALTEGALGDASGLLQDVRDLLVAAGVPAERIELRKPALTTGDGDPREARRVEVTLQ